MTVTVEDLCRRAVQEIKILSAQCETAESHIASLEQANKLLDTTNARRGAEMRAAKERITSLESKIDAIGVTATEAQAHAAALESELVTSYADIACLNESLAQSTTDLASHRDLLDREKAARILHEQEIIKLQSANNRLDGAIKVKDTEIRNLRSRIDEIESDNKSADGMNTQMRDELTKSFADVKRLTTMIEQMNANRRRDIEEAVKVAKAAARTEMAAALETARTPQKTEAIMDLEAELSNAISNREKQRPALSLYSMGAKAA